jgi:hypothetical protein
MNDEADVVEMVNAIRLGVEMTGTDLEVYEQELLRAAEKEPWSFAGATGYCQDIEDLHALHAVNVTLAQVVRFVQVGAKALGWRDVTVGKGDDASDTKVAVRRGLPYVMEESELRIDPETHQITLRTWCEVGGSCESPPEYVCQELGTWDLQTLRPSTVAASVLGALAKQAAHEAIEYWLEEANL